MAWTDQCKVEACNQVQHKADAEGISKKQAIAKLADESGIPAKTIEHWFYGPTRPPENSGDEDPQRADVGTPTPRREKDQTDHIVAVTKKLTAAVKYANKHIDLPLQCDGETRGDLFDAAGKVAEFTDEMRKVVP